MIHTAPAQIFNSISNFVMPIGVPAEEAKTEIETHPKISKCSIEFKDLRTFFSFFTLIHIGLFI